LHQMDKYIQSLAKKYTKTPIPKIMNADLKGRIFIFLPAKVIYSTRPFFNHG